MTQDSIIVSKQAPAAIITLNRPEKYNAFNLETIAALIQALDELEADTDVRGIIIAGHERFFSTGADLDDVTTLRNGNDMAKFLRKVRKLTDAIEQNAKPVIAAISGWCLTGGLELAMACDIRVADATAKFGMTSAKNGSLSGSGGTQRLARLVGTGKAKELLFSAEVIDAEEAHRINLINRMVPAGQAIAEARRMVATYEQRGPISLQFAKQAVNIGIQMDLNCALDYEISLVSRIYDTEDRAEGMRAFLEKRTPVFRGR